MYSRISGDDYLLIWRICCISHFDVLENARSVVSEDNLARSRSLSLIVSVPLSGWQRL